MAAYIIVDGLVIDADKMEQYKVLAKPLVESFGGEYLARGGALSVKENQRWTPNRLVLLKFPSMAQAEAFYNAADYQAILPLSHQASERTLVIFEGM